MIKPLFVFFDLDNTLIDHTHAETAALHSTYLDIFGSADGFDEFRLAYHTINLRLWDAYSHSRISKDDVKFGRFDESVGQLTSDKIIIDKFTALYYENYARFWKAIPGADDAIKFVKNAGFRVGVLSNGFIELQYLKIEKMGWTDLFETIVLSEEAGVQKPYPGIFRFAEEKTGLPPDNHLYIGDSIETDIKGAVTAGWKSVFFDFSGKSRQSDLAEFSLNSWSEFPDKFSRLTSF